MKRSHPTLISAALLLATSRAEGDACPEGQCLDPNGRCGAQSECFVDPCEVTTECDPGICTPNYCGGCNVVCSEPELDEEAWEDSIDPTDHQKFADELTALIYADDNECSSALGVSMAFSLVYPGSTEGGIEDIRDTLRYPEGSNARLVWEDTTQRMLAEYDGRDLGYSEAPLLRIANSVWFDEGDTLSRAYASVVGDYAMQVDFEDADSPAVINDWVSQSTDGLIDAIVPEDKPLFPPNLLIAVNSIYLKARWENQFQKYKTNLDFFYGSTGTSEAHFMNKVDYYHYSHDALPGYQVIELPFASSQMSMIFVLPLSDGGEAVSSTDLISAMEDLRTTRVALSLPKFKFESEYEDILKESLEDMGMEAPFDDGAGAMCGLFEDAQGCENIIIDKVIQKTVVDVNEDGVEAAAVTAVGVGITSAPSEDPILVVLDRPFQFFVYEGSEGLMLFEGRVGDPEVPEGAATPEYDARRSDESFWMRLGGVTPIAPPEFVVAVDDAPSTTLPTKGDACPEGQCLDPNGRCGAKSECFVDPCEVTTECDPGICTPNYCGGCNVVCSEPELDEEAWEEPAAVDPSTTLPTNASSVSATQSAEASGSTGAATQPAGAASDSTVTQSTETSGSTVAATSDSSTAQSTETSGSSGTTTLPVGASSSPSSQPTSQPTEADPLSSGASKRSFSLGTCIFLFLRLVYVW